MKILKLKPLVIILSFIFMIPAVLTSCEDKAPADAIKPDDDILSNSSGASETLDSPDLPEEEEKSEPYVIIRPPYTPAKLILPDISRNNSGLYVQKYEPLTIDGAVTTFQCAAAYNDTLNLNVDSVMVYAVNRQALDSAFPSWIEKKDLYLIDMMIALNRDNTDWTANNPKAKESIQTRKNGSLCRHGSDPNSTNFYMVPTKEWIEYIWELLVMYIDKYHPRMIALEEPEMWHDSGYSQGFKEEWQDYYKEPWQDPASSPEALFKAQKLKTYLFERIIKIISDRIKEKIPDALVYIATHSTLNYNAWSITAGLNHYMALGAIDGVIGQTWSDTVYAPVPYQGKSVQTPFAAAFLEYASYVDSVRGTDFFALADPKADNPDLNWDTYAYLYQHTVTASLLQPEIHRFELFPWPDRSFTPAPSKYKTYQMNVFNAMKNLSGEQAEITAGTPGISVALSDTVSWQFGNASWGERTADGVYGMSLPLIAKGIPVKFKALELIQDKSALDDTSVLILSYDCMKPTDEQYNIAVAEWVKQGGTVLYIGGTDMFALTEGQWWLDKDDYPVNNLLGHLGLDNIRFQEGPTGKNVLSWANSGFSDKDIIEKIEACEYPGTKFCGKFEGGTNAIVKAGDLTVGIDEKAGEGRFIGISLPSAMFSKSAKNADMLRALVKYALQYTQYEYAEANLLSAKRGDYFTAYAIEKDEKITGRFINIYDSELSVITEKTIKADESVFLMDISKIDCSEAPVLAFTGGRLGDYTGEPGKTVFTLSVPSSAVASSRLLARPGIYPQSVTAKTNGIEVDVISRWENATNSLLVQCLGSSDPTVIEVIWGGTPVEDGIAYEFKNLTIPTNSKNLDEPYIFENTAFVNDGLRFCDLDGYIIYRFDLKEYPDALLSFGVFQNYIVEISGDGINFVETHNFKEIHPEHLTDGSNHTVITFNPSDYDFIGDAFYFKLSNTDASTGWGGSITNIYITYKAEK